MVELPAPPIDPDDFVDRVLTYVQAVDASLVASIQGASEAEIQQYEAASRTFGADRPLPGVYAAFLRRMGKRHGELFKGMYILVDITEVLDIYAEFSEIRPDPINPRLPLAGRQVIGDEIALDLDSNPTDPEVVVTSGGQAYDWLSQSWAHLLARAAILHVEPRRRAARGWYSSSAESAAQALGAAEDKEEEARKRIDALAAQLGMSLVWPSDARHRVALSQDATLMAELGQSGDVLLQLFADSPGVFDRIGAAAAEALGTRSGVIR